MSSGLIAAGDIFAWNKIFKYKHTWDQGNRLMRAKTDVSVVLSREQKKEQILRDIVEKAHIY